MIWFVQDTKPMSTDPIGGRHNRDVVRSSANKVFSTLNIFLSRNTCLQCRRNGTTAEDSYGFVLRTMVVSQYGDTP